MTPGGRQPAGLCLRYRGHEPSHPVCVAEVTAFARTQQTHEATLPGHPAGWPGRTRPPCGLACTDGATLWAGLHGRGHPVGWPGRTRPPYWLAWHRRGHPTGWPGRTRPPYRLARTDEATLRAGLHGRGQPAGWLKPLPGWVARLRPPPGEFDCGILALAAVWCAGMHSRMAGTSD